VRRQTNVKKGLMHYNPQLVVRRKIINDDLHV